MYPWGMTLPQGGRPRKWLGGRLLLGALFLALASSTAQAGTPEGLALYAAGDYPAAFREFGLAAGSADPQAQMYLGLMSLTGRGVTRDTSAGLKLLQQAADAGQSEALFLLGEAHRVGAGVPKDFQQALTTYRQAADQGSVSAMYQLGLLYSAGTPDIGRDPAQAVTWYTRAAQATGPTTLFGYTRADAMMALGRLHSLGTVPAGQPDAAQAFGWYRQAAELRHPAGLLTAGYLLLKGQGTPKNNAVVERYFVQLSELEPRYRDVPSRLLAAMGKEVQLGASIDALIVTLKGYEERINAYIKKGNASGARSDYREGAYLAAEADEKVVEVITQGRRIMEEYSKISDAVGLNRPDSEYTEPLTKTIAALENKSRELRELFRKLAPDLAVARGWGDVALRDW